ncbi:MAG: type II secretion system inner membrane protein GspF [Deltaproteobacteria bacterium]|nr:type II secretion system inner membrane protein GspF [Deltaproteobacteria bacterium]
MPIYEYKGMNAKGKALSGVLDADSPRSLKERLFKEGIFLSEYVESRAGQETRRAGQQQAGSREVKLGRFMQRVKLLELSEVTRQLATLVKSGIQLVDAIGAIAEQLENAYFKKVLTEVKRLVSEGSTLANALKKHPKVFSDLYVNMVGSGEASGTLDVVFDRLADVIESQVKLRGKLTSALMYPAIMMLLGFGIMMLMMVFVIPQMRELFTKMGAELPFLTRFLITISDFLVGYWWLVFLMLAGALFAFDRWRRSEKGRPAFDRITLRVPIFGRLVREIIVARFSRSLATLLEAGVPILSALQIVRAIVGNWVYGEAVEAAKDAVKEGQSMADTLKRSGQFPPMVCHMIGVGEKSGQLEGMLNNVANSYETQVEQKVSRLTAVLEPVMIVIMGGIVGMMVLAIVLPMLQMNQLAGRR